MSLSDEERLRGMYYAIRNLTGVAKQWRSDHRLQRNRFEDDFTEVRDLIDKLWHAFLGGDTQGMLWFMGPDSVQTIKGEPQSPWALALTCTLEEKVKKVRGHRDWQYDGQDPFNALDHLCITSLLNHDDWKGVPASYLLKAYQHTETIMYYLRRYNDDFSDRYEKVSALISQIQGECFRVFSERDCFAKAYLIHEMMEILYGGGYPYSDPDVVTSILSSEVLHHDFTALMKLPLEDLIPHHIELVQTFEAARKRTNNKEYDDYELTRLRLFKVIEFSTKTHQYEHVRDKIVATLEGTDLAKEIPKVKKAWKRLKKAWKKNKEAENKRYDDNAGSPLDCYGFEAYSIEREAEAEKKIVPKKAKKPRKKTKKKKK